MDLLAALIDAGVRGELTREQAERLATLGPEAVVLFSLALTRRVAELQAKVPGLATPSAMVPVYAKPPVKRRGKKPGAKDGHAGSHLRRRASA